MENKRCRGCGVEKALDRFYTKGRSKVTGTHYYRSSCIDCVSKTRKDTNHLRKKVKRIDGVDRVKWILYDTRSSDAKKHRHNNLTEVFVGRLISQPCTYCGDTKLLRTLDRIDNKLGHTEKNVVTACIRCNYLRRDMPYAAWLHISTSVKEAYEKGLFLDWVPSARKADNKQSINGLDEQIG